MGTLLLSMLRALHSSQCCIDEGVGKQKHRGMGMGIGKGEG